MSDNLNEPPQGVMPSHPLGFYVHFATFRDASKDVVPRRTRPATGRAPGSTWVETIYDEAEWLARPDLWAVDLFPRSKGKLAEFYSVTWLADNFLDCMVCRPLVDSLFPETGFDASRLDAIDWLNVPTDPHERFLEFPLPSVCGCGRNSIAQLCRGYTRGLMDDDGLYNRLIERLHSGGDPWPRSGQTDEQRAVLLTRRNQGWDYGRNLALDLCGPNPFRPVAFDPRWLSESAVALARTAYDTRNFSLLPILADALEDAGCDSAEVLAHCRGSGPHVRGCWVVDAVLNL